MLLIIDKSRRNGKALRSVAYMMGVLSYSATPYELFKEINPYYSAILMINPDNYKEDREYYEKVYSYKLGMPLFAFYTEKQPHKFDEYFDKIFYENFSPITLNDMITYAKVKGVQPIGKYCGFGFQASMLYDRPEYFDEEMPATKSENMILRLMLRVYPSPMNPANIIKYAFRPGKPIEPASIRTHISLLNKNCRDIVKRNVVEFIPHKGYVLNAPKVNEEYLKQVMKL